MVPMTDGLAFSAAASQVTALGKSERVVGNLPWTSWQLCRARPICLRLLELWVRAAASRTFWTAGSSRPIRMAMMAITTKSSISVNPRQRRIMALRMNDMTPPSRRAREVQKRYHVGVLTTHTHIHEINERPVDRSVYRSTSHALAPGAAGMGTLVPEC